MKMYCKLIVIILTSHYNIFTLALTFLLYQSLLFAQKNTSSIDKLPYNYLEEIFEQISDPEKATLAFFQALEKLRIPNDKNADKVKHLYYDVVDILPADKMQEWQTLQTQEDRITFLKRFWLENDLTPATVANERLVEHYKRLLYARHIYSYINQRGYDDRGLIYIKYGRPDDYVIDAINPDAVPVTSWVYFKFGGSINFDFIDEGFGYYLNSDLSKALRAFNPINDMISLESLVDRRFSLSPQYARLFFELEQIKQNSLGPNELHAAMERATILYSVEVENKQTLLPTTVSEILSEIEELPCTLTLAKFQGIEQMLDLVAIYGFRKTDLKSKGDKLEVQMATALRNETREFLTNQEITCPVAIDSSKNEEEVVLVENHSLPAGKYYFALDVTNPSGNQRGLSDFSLTLGRYPENEMCLSSALFAREVRTAVDKPPNSTSLKRYNLLIQPYPFTNLKRNKPIYVYFEIYSLQQNAAGETYYEIEYKVKTKAKKGLSSFLASLNPFDKDSGGIAITEKRRGKKTTEPSYLQLDFHQLRPGKYDFILRVTDKLAKISKERKLKIELE